MLPTEFFNKPVIGILKTRTIAELNLRPSELDEYRAASVEEEKQYDVIDIILQDGEKFFVTNTWSNANLNVVFCIHNNFVKYFTESK